MTHYFDIKLDEGKPFKLANLMNEVYSCLHKKFWDHKELTIGLSFPEYGEHLGKVIRLHGNETELKKLHHKSWANERATKLHFSDISPIPSAVNFAVFSRIQQTQSNSKLKRFIKRNNPSEQEIRAYKAKMFSQGLDLPYVELISKSTSQRHRVYNKKTEVDSPSENQAFTTYGLSKSGSTVPIF